MAGNDDNSYDVIVFNGETDSRLKEKALDRAWATRNFEIELYWKRALYFWGFIALAFTGLFSLGEEGKEYAFIITCIGSFLSLAWVLTNKASKFWQENWEAHIDCLENEFEGRLYKIVLSEKKQFKTFSVSKLNGVISEYILVVWVFLLIKSLMQLLQDLTFYGDIKIYVDGLFLLISVIFVFFLFFRCKSSLKCKEVNSLKEPHSKYNYCKRIIDSDK